MASPASGRGDRQVSSTYMSPPTTMKKSDDDDDLAAFHQMVEDSPHDFLLSFEDPVDMTGGVLVSTKALACSTRVIWWDPPASSSLSFFSLLCARVGDSIYLTDFLVADDQLWKEMNASSDTSEVMSAHTPGTGSSQPSPLGASFRKEEEGEGLVAESDVDGNDEEWLYMPPSLRQSPAPFSPSSSTFGRPYSHSAQELAGVRSRLFDVEQPPPSIPFAARRNSTGSAVSTRQAGRAGPSHGHRHSNATAVSSSSHPSTSAAAAPFRRSASGSPQQLTSAASDPYSLASPPVLASPGSNAAKTGPLSSPASPAVRRPLDGAADARSSGRLGSAAGRGLPHRSSSLTSSGRRSSVPSKAAATSSSTATSARRSLSSSLTGARSAAAQIQTLPAGASFSPASQSQDSPGVWANGRAQHHSRSAHSSPGGGGGSAAGHPHDGMSNGSSSRSISSSKLVSSPSKPTGSGGGSGGPRHGKPGVARSTSAGSVTAGVRLSSSPGGGTGMRQAASSSPPSASASPSQKKLRGGAMLAPAPWPSPPSASPPDLPPPFLAHAQAEAQAWDDDDTPPNLRTSLAPHAEGSSSGTGSAFSSAPTRRASAPLSFSPSGSRSRVPGASGASGYGVGNGGSARASPGGSKGTAAPAAVPAAVSPSSVAAAHQERSTPVRRTSFEQLSPSGFSSSSSRPPLRFHEVTSVLDLKAGRSSPTTTAAPPAALRNPASPPGGGGSCEALPSDTTSPRELPPQQQQHYGFRRLRPGIPGSAVLVSPYEEEEEVTSVAPPLLTAATTRLSPPGVQSPRGAVRSSPHPHLHELVSQSSLPLAASLPSPRRLLLPANEEPVLQAARFLPSPSSSSSKPKRSRSSGSLAGSGKRPGGGGGEARSRAMPSPRRVNGYRHHLHLPVNSDAKDYYGSTPSGGPGAPSSDDGSLWGPGGSDTEEGEVVESPAGRHTVNDEDDEDGAYADVEESDGAGERTESEYGGDHSRRNSGELQLGSGKPVNRGATGGDDAAGEVPSRAPGKLEDIAESARSSRDGEGSMAGMLLSTEPPQSSPRVQVADSQGAASAAGDDHCSSPTGMDASASARTSSQIDGSAAVRSVSGSASPLPPEAPSEGQDRVSTTSSHGDALVAAGSHSMEPAEASESVSRSSREDGGVRGYASGPPMGNADGSRDGGDGAAGELLLRESTDSNSGQAAAAPAPIPTAAAAGSATESERKRLQCDGPSEEQQQQQQRAQLQPPGTPAAGGPQLARASDGDAGRGPDSLGGGATAVPIAEEKGGQPGTPGTGEPLEAEAADSRMLSGAGPGTPAGIGAGAGAGAGQTARDGSSGAASSSSSSSLSAGGVQGAGGSGVNRRGLPSPGRHREPLPEATSSPAAAAAAAAAVGGLFAGGSEGGLGETAMPVGAAGGGAEGESDAAASGSASPLLLDENSLYVDLVGKVKAQIEGWKMEDSTMEQMGEDVLVAPDSLLPPTLLLPLSLPSPRAPPASTPSPRVQNPSLKGKDRVKEEEEEEGEARGLREGEAEREERGGGGAASPTSGEVASDQLRPAGLLEQAQASPRGDNTAAHMLEGGRLHGSPRSAEVDGSSAAAVLTDMAEPARSSRHVTAPFAEPAAVQDAPGGAASAAPQGAADATTPQSELPSLLEGGRPNYAELLPRPGPAAPSDSRAATGVTHGPRARGSSSTTRSFGERGSFSALPDGSKPLDGAGRGGGGGGAAGEMAVRHSGSMASSSPDAHKGERASLLAEETISDITPPAKVSHGITTEEATKAAPSCDAIVHDGVDGAASVAAETNAQAPEGAQETPAVEKEPLSDLSVASPGGGGVKVSLPVKLDHVLPDASRAGTVDAHEAPAAQEQQPAAEAALNASEKAAEKHRKARGGGTSKKQPVCGCSVM
eukprot:jgi/Mesen1/9828/ME000007S09883